MCIDVVICAPGPAPPVKIPFLLLSSLLPPFLLSLLLSLSPPLPEAGLGVPLSAGSRQDGAAVPPLPGEPTRRPQPPLAHAGAGQARPPASLPQCLAAVPTPRPEQGAAPGPPGAAAAAAQPRRLQQRLGGLGRLPPLPPARRARQEPRSARQEVRECPGWAPVVPAGIWELGSDVWGAAPCYPLNPSRQSPGG